MDPITKTLLKCRWFQVGKDSPIGSKRGNSILERNVSSEPTFPGFSKFQYPFPRVCPADVGANSNENHIEKRVAGSSGHTDIFQHDKILNETRRSHFRRIV